MLKALELEKKQNSQLKTADLILNKLTAMNSKIEIIILNKYL